MRSILQSFFNEVPWLKPVLLWCLALLVLALPAYLVMPYARRLRDELREYLERVRRRNAEARDTREASIRRLAEDCQRQLSLRQMADRHSLLQDMLRPLLKSLGRLEKTLKTSLRKFGGLQRAMPRLVDRLKAPSSQEFKELPSADGLHTEVRALRSARDKLAISSLFLIAATVVNTGMLSQILRDLGWGSGSFPVLDIPNHVIFALILTIIEAGIGYLHGAGGWKSLLAISVFLILACVEGFFYSLVAPKGEEIIPLLQMRRGTLFFLYGLVPVTVLFAFGSAWHDAWDDARGGNTLTKLKRVLDKLRNGQAAHTGALEQTSVQVAKTRARAEECERLLASDNDKAETVNSAAERVRNQIEVMRDHPPSWACAGETDLSVADVYQLANLAAVWLFLALLATFGLIYTGWELLWYLAGGLPLALYLALGAIQVVIFLGSGLLFRVGEIVVGKAGSRTIAVWAPIQNRTLQFVWVALVAGVYFYIALRPDVARYQSVFWLFNLLLGLLLGAAAYHLANLLVVAHLLLLRIWNLASSSAERTSFLVVRFFGILFTLVEHALAFLASPVFALTRQSIPLAAPVQYPAVSTDGRNDRGAT